MPTTVGILTITSRVNTTSEWFKLTIEMLPVYTIKIGEECSKKNVQHDKG